jgi:hypothetical protein
MKKLIIDGQTYEVGVFPAMQHHQISIKFGKILGSSIETFFNIFKTDMETKIDLGILGSAIAKMINAIDEYDPSGEFMLVLFSQTLRNGSLINKQTFDQFYTGNMAEMYKALYFSVKVHFAHFFSLIDIGSLLTLGQPANPDSAESSTKA